MIGRAFIAQVKFRPRGSVAISTHVGPSGNLSFRFFIKDYTHRILTSREKARQREYYAMHREERHKTDRERYMRNRSRMKYNRDVLKSEVIATIAKHRNRPAECMIDITPDAVTDGVRLLDLPHSRSLEIDHINGRGTRETGYGHPFYRRITNRSENLDALRLLCIAHNRLYRAEGVRV